MVPQGDDAGLSQEAGRFMRQARPATLSATIVEEIRAAILEGRLRPGDPVGTEKTVAAQAGTSRIVARDAFRTLEAMGLISVRVGAGGGARVAAADPLRCADALAVQLALAGAGADEVLDVQLVLEGLSAEQAALHATAEDLQTLQRLIAAAAAHRDDTEAFTRLSLEFHLAVARIGRNRVLHAQLLSLHFVSWPRNNPGLTPARAEQVLVAHAELAERIGSRDPAQARACMERHVGMIRTHRSTQARPGLWGCC